ncbi:MAG: F0F1 ATP synthase subunit delta [Candidatus Microsaccharimonas sp.]
MARKLSRRSVATYIAKQMVDGAQVRTLAQQLAAYLVESRRTSEIDLVLRDIQYYLAEKGYLSCTVTSAFELSDATRKLIEAFAKNTTGATTVTLESVVDPTVLGGIKISLPGKEFDATIARSLTTLRTRYKKA